LIDWLNRYVVVDNCAIFQVVPSKPLAISHLFTCGRLSRSVSKRLAEEYVNTFGSRDPILQDVGKDDEEFLTILRRPAIEAYDDQYQARLFAAPNLIDKVSALRRTQHGYIYLNLYRIDDSGPFSEEDHLVLILISPLAAASVMSRSALHSFLSAPETTDIIADQVTLNPRPPFDQLTQREREVCERILKGLSTGGIALDLGTAPSTI